jgi:hypothetical protein
MYKHTTIYYPHIVKQYESIEQFVADNGYDDYYAKKMEELQAIGIDRNNAEEFKWGLSEDGFEAKVTITFASVAEWESKQEIITNRVYNDMKKPIFEEEFLGQSTEHL